MEDEEDQQRAVRDFELTQAGLDRANNQALKRRTADDEKGDAAAGAGTKRKFSLDDDELERIAREDKVKARKAIDDEKVSRTTLTSDIYANHMLYRRPNQRFPRSGALQ